MLWEGENFILGILHMYLALMGVLKPSSQMSASRPKSRGAKSGAVSPEDVTDVRSVTNVITLPNGSLVQGPPPVHAALFLTKGMPYFFQICTG